MKAASQPSRTGAQTPRSIATPSLGRFVTVRRRADGTARVYFEVPKRLRPSGWLPAIPVPLKGRTGRLDTDEVARIRKDAADLYAELLADRAANDAACRPAVDERRTMRVLARAWQNSQAFKSTAPRTQRSYAYHASRLVGWAEGLGDPDPSLLPRAAAEAMLSVFDDKPTTRRHLKIVLKMLMDQAIALGWRTDNPVERMKMRVPESHVEIWEAADVDFYADACVTHGHPAIAALIRTQWEIGQRLTDARLFRRGAEWDEATGAFRFYQSKTRSYVTIPVSDALRAILAASKQDGSLYLFTDAETGKPYSESALAHSFALIREKAGAGDGRWLVIRALRHSCVVQLARAGCTVPEIASITGHSLFSAQSILSRYLPRDNEVAWRAQVKRGLLAENSRSEPVHRPVR